MTSIERLTKRSYNVFIDYIASNYPDSEITLLSGYLDWLSDYAKLTLPYNLSSEEIHFSFPTSSKDTVFNDLLTKLKELSKPQDGRRRYPTPEFNLRVVDIEEEMSSIESFDNTKNIKWISDPNQELGFFYYVINPNSTPLFITTYIELDVILEEHPRLKKKLARLSGWDDLFTARNHDGKHSDEWMGLTGFFEDNLASFALSQLQQVLKNFTIIHCSDSYYTLLEGIGGSYYVLSGYNENPRYRRGEALAIEDFCY